MPIPSAQISLHLLFPIAFRIATARDWAYSEHNVTVLDMACRAEIRFLPLLKSKLDSLSEDEKAVAERYLEDFDDANSGLEGFQDGDEDGKVRAVTFNPISELRMLSRFINYQEKLIPLGLNTNFLSPFRNSTKRHFTSSEYIAMSSMIIDLCNTYGFNISQFAEGQIFGKQTGTSLRAEHCYTIAAIAMSRDVPRYDIAMRFVHLALIKNEVEKRQNQMEIEEFIDEIIQEHDQVYDEISGDPNSSENRIKYYSLFTQKIGHLRQEFPHSYVSKLIPRRMQMRYRPDHIQHSSWELCFAGDIRSEEVRRHLFCWLGTPNHYWTIQPLKLEQIYEDPDIFQIYDVFGENTIKLLKENFVATFKYGRMFRGPKDVEGFSFQGVFRSVLNESHFPDLRPFMKTLEKLSGLNAAWGDWHKPVGRRDNYMNYNLYTPGDFRISHTDSDDRTEPLDFTVTDDIVATMQIGLEEPEFGGDTTFHSAMTVAKPIKGSVLFWYSLRKDGTPDPRTSHCACPVALGRKWNAVKWMDYRDQLLTKPCGLSPLDQFEVFESPRKGWRSSRRGPRK